MGARRAKADRSRGVPLVAAAMLVAFAPDGARAIMSGAKSRLAAPGDSDYAAGREALEREDWQAAVANLALVVLRWPWHDNTHAVLGQTWRKLGREDEARAALLKLAEVCDLVVLPFGNRGWKSGCEELEVLQATIRHHGVPFQAGS